MVKQIRFHQYKHLITDTSRFLSKIAPIKSCSTDAPNRIVMGIQRNPAFVFMQWFDFFFLQ